MSLTPSALRILRELSYEIDADILCQGPECFCGTRKVSRRVVNELERVSAITVEHAELGVMRYTLNSTGEAILRRPELGAEIATAILCGRAFSIVNDQIQNV